MSVNFDEMVFLRICQECRKILTVNAKVFKAVNGSKSGHAVTLLSFDLRYFNLINLKVILVKNVEENLIQIIIKFLGEVIGINANIDFSNF